MYHFLKNFKYLTHPLSFLLIISALFYQTRIFSYAISKTNSLENNYIMGGYIGRYDVELGIFKVIRNKPELITTLLYKTSSITNFTEFIGQVLNDLATQRNMIITHACFGVPGNTTSDRLYIQAPHLSFPVDGQEILQRKLLNQTFVINDFEVQGYGLDCIDQKNIIQINKGIERNYAPRTLVGAGAGLGSVLMIWDTLQEQYTALPLGACFTDFAPQTRQELEFAQYVKQNITHTDNCSWGQILGSGSGITGIYNYFTSLENNTSSPTTLDADTIFTQRDTDYLCKKSVDFYMRLYAQLIRTMAYVVLPYGGLYITNTIATKHSSLIINPEFINEIFNCRHDWLKDMLSGIPLYVVTDPMINLYGAANYVLKHSQN